MTALEIDSKHISRDSSAKILRFKGELIYLFFLILIIILLAFFTFKIHINLLIGTIIFSLLYIRLLQAQQLGNSLQVSEFQSPDIFNLAKECAAILRLKKMPKVYITQDPIMNAYTMGFMNPYTVVLNSGVVENLSHNEIRTVIGHEFGHIKFRHSMILSFISPIGKNFVFADFLFGFWSRKTEYTADRCGLICSGGNKIAFIKTLIKIAAGAKIGEKVDLEKLSLQLQNAKERRIDKAGELFGSHPYILKRIWEINKFSYQYNISPCENCGNINLMDANFCWSCRNKLKV